MDDKTQKERLEQELRFLKESFEAEVISKEEFEKGKDRIEKKLKEIEKEAKEQVKETKKEIQEDKPKEELVEKEVEIRDEKVSEKTEEKIKLNVIQEETEQHFEPTQIKEPTPIIEKPKVEIKEDNKLFKYAVIFVVVVLIAFFSYSFIKEKKVPKAEQTKFAIEIQEITKTNVAVLNDRKNCFNCDTQRVLNILENWFVIINAKEIDYNTNGGKAIAEKFDAKLLPLYILDENITKKQSFEQFKQVFIKKDNSYILSEDASGATFYFKRDNIPNKLDLFVISNDEASIKAEKNLKEFLDIFKEIKFEKHLSNDRLTQELKIKTFPTFLVNNRVKFSGIHPPETIKNNFCKLNKLKECEKSLSKNLI